MEKRIKKMIENILKQDERLWNEDKTELNQTLLLDLIEKIDEKVIDLLLQEKDLREKFFVKIKTSKIKDFDHLKGVSYVFKTNEFRFFMEENKVDNSFTAYKNRIGLTDGKKFLKDTNDVVLDFPYKDCVLEGGQSTEEGTDIYFEYDEKVTKTNAKKYGHKAGQYNQKTAKIKEIFFNQVLAHDEIDRLFDAKAFTNWKRYSKDGVIELSKKNSEIRDFDNKGKTPEIKDFDNKGETPEIRDFDNKEKTPEIKDFDKKGETPEIKDFDKKGETPEIRDFDPLKGVRAVYGNKFGNYEFTFPANRNLVEKAKEMAQNMTKAEQIMWFQILKSKQTNFKWLKQKVIDNYIVDFYCHTLGLVIEIDGDSHIEKVEYDKIRTELLNHFGLKVLRYSNNDVYHNLQSVKKDLLYQIQLRQNEFQQLPLLRSQNPQDFGGLKRGTIKENMIIKGNNLLALHSLKKQFAGKVKLIYIDPPYNTGNDGFKYNDNFNHSTWLTFMKNRLEVAKKLLRDDGSIWISLDDREFAYLKVLCDDIFGKNNFLNDVIWNSTKSVTNTAIISVSHTHNLVYFKNKDYYVKNRTEFRLDEDGEGFSNPDNDPRGAWKADPFQVGGWRPNQQYEIKNPNTGVVYKPNENCSWKNDFNKFQELLKDNRIIFGTDGKAGPQRKRFLFEAKERGKVAKTIWNEVGTTTNGTQHLKKIFNKAIFDNPKPEKFVKRIIELSTNENDIVLDYHLGSGTTAAVAHKMGRQYIGIEQMDYIETIAVERLKKVIEGEQGGISKSVNWQGGGDFIYFELAKWNETAKEKILVCESLDELIAFFDEMYERYFLNYNLKIKEFREKVIKEEEFKNLSLDEQKKMFVAMLDNNQMYVNKTEMADKKFGISEEDQNLTSQFYKEEK